MRKNLITVIIATLILTSFKANNTTTYKATVSDSEITWKGSRPGKTHHGTLNISQGTLVFEDNKLISGNFDLDMNTIKVLDIKPGKMNEKLVNHFNSSDFFDVKNHPSGKFIITDSEAVNNKTLINGKLTIKGITNDVSFLADISKSEDNVTLKSGEFKIDRTKWNIKFRSGKFFDNLKNKLIYDDITITVKVKAKK